MSTCYGAGTSHVLACDDVRLYYVQYRACTELSGDWTQQKPTVLSNERDISHVPCWSTWIQCALESVSPHLPRTRVRIPPFTSTSLSWLAKSSEHYKLIPKISLLQCIKCPFPSWKRIPFWNISGKKTIRVKFSFWLKSQNSTHWESVESYRNGHWVIFPSLWNTLSFSQQVLFVFAASGIFHYSSDIHISHCFLRCSRFRKKYAPDSNVIWMPLLGFMANRGQDHQQVQTNRTACVLRGAAGQDAFLSPVLCLRLYNCVLEPFGAVGLSHKLQQCLGNRGILSFTHL